MSSELYEVECKECGYLENVNKGYLKLIEDTIVKCKKCHSEQMLPRKKEEIVFEDFEDDEGDEIEFE
tara:strand:- start:17779 stop:17979 length:201 start_codon:yes stop_codon:yes gene_type:complete